MLQENRVLLPCGMLKSRVARDAAKGSAYTAAGICLNSISPKADRFPSVSPSCACAQVSVLLTLRCLGSLHTYVPDCPLPLSLLRTLRDASVLLLQGYAASPSHNISIPTCMIIKYVRTAACRMIIRYVRMAGSPLQVSPAVGRNPYVVCAGTHNAHISTQP